MRIGFTLLPLFAGALLAGACGGGGSTPGTASGTPPVSDTGGSGGAWTSPPSATQPGGPPGAPSSPAGVEPTVPQTPARPAHEWVVSTTGNDTAPGTADAPVRSISRALTLAGPGDLIRVLAGTYAERVLIMDSVREGTAQAPITLVGEGKPRIVPGPEQGALMVVMKPYWTIRGFDIDVQKHAALGVAFAGNLEGTFLADSEVHNATYGAGVSFHGGAHGATLENNHIHDNFLQGDDAHGVIIQPTAHDITVRNNVIHGNSGDSIQCYNEDGANLGAPADNILIEGNDLYGNVEQGLDIKTCSNITVRHNKLHHSRQGNGAMVVHLSAKNILIEENDFYDSGLAIGVGGNRVGAAPSGIVIRRNIIRDMLTDPAYPGMVGGGLQMADSSGTQVVNNTFTRLKGPALIVGTGDGGPTQDLVVKNNIIDAAEAVREVSSQSPGLKLGSNLYPPGTTFRKDGASMNLSQWQAQGYDGNSREGDAQLDPTTLKPGPAAIDAGERLDLGTPCGAGTDIGAVETGC